ncbi:hypothetical protein LguiA_036046 [Lonicera macranthoides]
MKEKTLTPRIQNNRPRDEEIRFDRSRFGFHMADGPVPFHICNDGAASPRITHHARRAMQFEFHYLTEERDNLFVIKEFIHPFHRLGTVVWIGHTSQRRKQKIELLSSSTPYVIHPNFRPILITNLENRRAPNESGKSSAIESSYPEVQKIRMNRTIKRIGGECPDLRDGRLCPTLRLYSIRAGSKGKGD